VQQKQRQKLKKTIKIPISSKITKEKHDKLDRLTARLTYGTRLFLEIIIQNDITTRKDANKYSKEIQQMTGLPSAFVQCCRDKALWMYKSYKKSHRKWQKQVEKLEKSVKRCKDKHKLKKLKHKLYRLKKREPSLPTVDNKVPVMFDRRIGVIGFSQSAREFKLWIRISTLKKGDRVDIPLHSYKYAERHLREWEIKSFQLIYRSKLKRYEVHVVVEKEVVVSNPKTVVGIDLGLKRLIVGYIETVDGENRVLLVEKSEHKEFFIRMRRLNNRIGKLQRLKKYRVLKKLKHKRRNYTRNFRRKLAKEVAKEFGNSVVFIGHPKNIRTDKHYKGSGNRKNRKRINHWAFHEFAEILRIELMENNNLAYIINEWLSTKTCSECGSRNTEVDDRHFRCFNCNYEDDRDINASKNILKKGMKITKVSVRTGAAVTQPLSVDDRVKALEHTTSLRRASPVGVGCPPF
jgi:putative transposase